MKKVSLFFVLTSLLASFSLAQVPQKTPPPMKLDQPMPANLFSELGRIINPAVVNISTSVISRGRLQRDPMLEMLERFYGVPMDPRGGGPRGGGPQQMGLGTGFIIREDGLIITNNHVIDGADLIQVQLSEKNDKLYEATVIGTDSRTDIALIKIKPDEKLPVAALGNSSDLQVGEWVAAFGNPFGHGHTMTKGIVSSIGREISEINRFPLIQTDANINPGNSGGPLVNSKGYVIGVNAAIDARGPGIGFAIPIDEVKKILPDLESRGSIRKGFLGIGLGDHTPEGAKDLGLDTKFPGAWVAQIEPQSPAAKSGLKVYDTITEINGKKMKNSLDVSDTISGFGPDSKLTLKVVGQNKKSRTIAVTIAERPDPKKIAKATRPENTKGQEAPHNLGFKVSDLTKELRQSLELSDDVSKPVIVGVDRGSIASLAGFRVGDIILEVNGQETTTAAEVLKASKKDKNTFRLARGRSILVLSF